MAGINIPKVRGKMGEKRMSLTSLANQLGVTRTTLNHYMEEPGKMPYGVVAKMANILCDTMEDATAFFSTIDFRDTKVERKCGRGGNMNAKIQISGLDELDCLMNEVTSKSENLVRTIHTLERLVGRLELTITKPEGEDSPADE